MNVFAIGMNGSRIISLYTLPVAYYAYTYQEFILLRGKSVKNLLILAEEQYEWVTHGENLFLNLFIWLNPSFFFFFFILEWAEFFALE